MSRCIIVAGADINNYERVLSFLSGDDFFIYCDSGLKHLEKLGFAPDLIVGDFDSYENPMMKTETIVLPRAKDDADSVYGAKEGIKRGFDDFVIIGATGGRIDHTINNVYLLQFLYSQGKKAVLIDEYSEALIVGKEPVFIPCTYPYFSLFAIGGTAENITIKKAKFPLENATINYYYQYGLSNEVLPGKTAEVSVGKGTLLLVKDI